jgi:DNA-binding NtrC family response regulator
MMNRILVIDDDAPFRGMLRQVLGREGYEVMEASNGKEGMALFRAEPTDLAISDILMPEQEGLQTIKELRRDFPEVKIIAISGGGHGGTMNFLNAATLLGAQRTLWKPFDLDELRQAVREVLNPS